MPTYTIRDPQSGRTLTIRGESPPTEQELTDLFASVAPASAAPPPPPASEPGLIQQAAGVLDMPRQAVVGGMKSLGQGAVGAGQMVAGIPGVADAINALYRLVGMDVDTKQALGDALRQPELTPNTPTERLGKTATDVAQFFTLPSGKGNLIRQGLTQAAGTGILAGTQGATKGEAGIGAVLAGSSPAAVKGVSKLAEPLREGAQKLVVQALGPTKERYKAMASKLAPEFLKRNLGGATGRSREALLETAKSNAAQAGRAVDQVLKNSGGQGVATAPILRAIDDAKAPFQTTTQMTAAELAGRPELAAKATPVGPDLFDVSVILDKRPIQQLNKLKAVVEDLGPVATVEQMVAVRRAWDKVVDQAGGYAQRGKGAIGVPLKDQSEAWAKREMTNAIRLRLSEAVPDLAKVNKEFAFWKSLSDVLKQTQQRTQPQTGGFAKSVMTGAGVAAGGASGDTASDRVQNAILGGALGRQAMKVFSSPRYKLASAHLRNRLADAIASGDTERIGQAIGRLSAFVGSRSGAMVPAR
jgi:hypothetical protein